MIDPLVFKNHFALGDGQLLALLWTAATDDFAPSTASSSGAVAERDERRRWTVSVLCSPVLATVKLCILARLCGDECSLPIERDAHMGSQVLCVCVRVCVSVCACVRQ